jgi:hypothetical protein
LPCHTSQNARRKCRLAPDLTHKVRGTPEFFGEFSTELAPLHADRKIDGKDIWPLLAGQTKDSPQEALFYFSGNKLDAVRSGPWELAVFAQPLRQARVDTEVVKHTGPGVREPGRVENPKPLLKRVGMEYD